MVNDCLRLPGSPPALQVAVARVTPQEEREVGQCTMKIMTMTFMDKRAPPHNGHTCTNSHQIPHF